MAELAPAPDPRLLEADVNFVFSEWLFGGLGGEILGWAALVVVVAWTLGNAAVPDWLPGLFRLVMLDAGAFTNTADGSAPDITGNPDPGGGATWLLWARLPFWGFGKFRFRFWLLGNGLLALLFDIILGDGMRILFGPWALENCLVDSSADRLRPDFD